MKHRLQVRLVESRPGLPFPVHKSLLGIADSMKEADQMVADHAAATGTPIDCHHYAISTLPYPDPESLAQGRIHDRVNNGDTLECLLAGQEYMGCSAYETQFGPGRSLHLQVDLKQGQIFARVGDDWQVFDIQKLFVEVKSGTKQAALL